MPDHMADLYAALAALASDLQYPDHVREAAVVILYHLDGVGLDALPDGPIDPTTGHPFRSDDDD